MTVSAAARQAGRTRPAVFPGTGEFSSAGLAVHAATAPATISRPATTISSHPGARACCSAISTTASAPANATPASANTRESPMTGGRGSTGPGAARAGPRTATASAPDPATRATDPSATHSVTPVPASLASTTANTGTEATDNTDDHVSRSARSARGLSTTAQK